MKPTLMLIGLGDLGGILLEFLAREEQIGRIVVGSRNQEKGETRCNLTQLGAIAQGFSPKIDFVPLNLNDKEIVAEVVQREEPDIIMSTATMLTWWLPNLLPPKQAKIIKSAGFGVWLPVHLTLTLKLMEALRHANYQGITLTAPFPDVINCVLGRLDLAPTCGVGNIDEIVPKVRLLAAERLKTSIDSVQVIMVAHHALQAVVFGGSKEEVPPYFLRIKHNGKDVTEAIQGDKLLLAPYPLTSGPTTHFLTAGSTMRLIREILFDSGKLLHAPGVLGLPGGYPIAVNRDGVKLVNIEGLSIEDAIRINEKSHRFDGIDRIQADGTVVFCSSAVEVLKTEFGYDCERLPPQKAEERSKELISCFQAYANSLGVQL